MVCKYFLMFCGLSFHFLDSIFWNTKVLNLDEDQFFSFLMFLVSYLFSSRTLIILDFMFRSWIRFELKILNDLFLPRERGRKGKREGEKHQSAASHSPPTWDLACNPGICPYRELNWQPLGSQASTQSAELHQPELELNFYMVWDKV